MTAPHSTGSGPFLLTTRAWIENNGQVVEYECVHRFATWAGREAYRVFADQFGIVASISEEEW